MKLFVFQERVPARDSPAAAAADGGARAARVREARRRLPATRPAQGNPTAVCRPQVRSTQVSITVVLRLQWLMSPRLTRKALCVAGSIPA